MTANEAIEIINNAHQYSDEEYNDAVKSIEEFYSESNKLWELRSQLLGYYMQNDKYDTFDAKTCRRILKIVFEEDE